MMRVKPLPLKTALLLALVLASIDQLSKIAIVFGDPFGGGFWTGFATHETQHILPFLDFTLIWNEGISYGLFAEGGNAGRYALIIVSLAAIGFFAYLIRGAAYFRQSLAYALIAGGALGNLIDRLWHGAVVDFISLHAAGYYWYVFNLADIWITFAVIILIYDAFRAR